MSTPSEHGSGSVTTPLPPLQSDEGQDTASSVLAVGTPPGVMVQYVPDAPNTAFTRRMRDARPRSMSPRQRRVVSPSLSMAQLRARTAEQKADTALSSAGRIADQTIHAWSVADDAIAEALAMREEVEPRLSELSQRAEANTSSVLGEVAGEVKRVVEQTQAQTSHLLDSLSNSWRKKLKSLRRA